MSMNTTFQEVKDLTSSSYSYILLQMVLDKPTSNTR